MEKATDENFETLVAKGECIAYFSAAWCGPCRMMGPIFEETDKEMKETTFIKLDVDETPKTATKYGVTSIPCLILFKDGKEVKQDLGLKDKDTLKSWITST